MEGVVSFRSIQIHLFAIDGIDTVHNFHLLHYILHASLSFQMVAFGCLDSQGPGSYKGSDISHVEGGEYSRNLVALAVGVQFKKRVFEAVEVSGDYGLVYPLVQGRGVEGLHSASAEAQGNERGRG